MLPVIRHEFLNLRSSSEEDIRSYKPFTRLVLRTFKYIYDYEEIIIEMLLISTDEMGPEVSNEDFNKYLDIIFIYISAVKKNISEEDIVQKIHELRGKGERIMTILQAGSLRQARRN